MISLSVVWNFPLAAHSRQAATEQMLVWLIVAGVVIAAICGCLVVTNKFAQRRRTNSHAGLFAGLCQYHNLDRPRRALLQAMAKAHRLRYPARVFLDPTLFELKRLPPALRPRKNEILALRQKLFSVAE